MADLRSSAFPVHQVSSVNPFAQRLYIPAQQFYRSNVYEPYEFVLTVTSRSDRVSHEVTLLQKTLSKERERERERVLLFPFVFFIFFLFNRYVVPILRPVPPVGRLDRRSFPCISSHTRTFAQQWRDYTPSLKWHTKKKKRKEICE